MKLFKYLIEKNTRGENDLIDITDDLKAFAKKSGVEDGFIIVFVVGSTASILTMEYEPGLIQDVKELFEKLIPHGKIYAHNRTWNDDNGHSHLRATIIGQSMTIPVQDGTMMLGTWQQVVLAEFDHRPRQRRVVVQIYNADE